MTEKIHTVMLSSPTHGRRGASGRLEFSATAIGLSVAKRDPKRKASVVTIAFRTRQVSDGKKPRTWILHLNTEHMHKVRDYLNDLANTSGLADIE